MNYFSSVWFKVCLIVIAVLFFCGAFLHWSKNETIKRFNTYPEETKTKLVSIYSKAIPIYKILFWMSPIYLVFIPIFVYFNVSEIFPPLMTALVLAYVGSTIGFLYMRTMLKAAGKYGK